MRKVSFLLLLIFVTGCTYHIKNLDSQGEVIVCFGDSITEGVGADEGKDYPSLLSSLLEKKVINAGVAGDTTATALERLQKDVLSKDPYLVIVELGGNDFLFQVPKEVTLKNLEEIILRIQRKGAMVVLVDVSCDIILKGYRNDFKKLAKRTGSIFIPNILKEILNNPSLKSDWIHPNNEGYKIIAERVYNVVKRYVR